MKESWTTPKQRLVNRLLPCSKRLKIDHRSLSLLQTAQDGPQFTIPTSTAEDRPWTTPPTHTRTHARTHTHAHTHTHTRARAQTHTHTSTHARTHTHTHARTRAHTQHTHTTHLTQSTENNPIPLFKLEEPLKMY